MLIFADEVGHRGMYMQPHVCVGNHTRMDRPAWTDGADPCGGLRHDDRIEIAD